ncbi:hypothetical protein [Micromonospora chokoriensis]|uniref:hypothetical protein n=1 Tax=Micromonospora chokoriensis TaxID=356851 RepID=UPI0012FAD3DF|nr:hypothetical protein [Micromonospora chokoriensis]
MLSKTIKIVAPAVALAAIFSLGLEATPASAKGWCGSCGPVNTHIQTFSTDSECVWTKDRLNAIYGVDDEYYYCGGANHTELWWRHRLA